MTQPATVEPKIKREAGEKLSDLPQNDNLHNDSTIPRMDLRLETSNEAAGYCDELWSENPGCSSRRADSENNLECGHVNFTSLKPSKQRSEDKRVFGKNNVQNNSRDKIGGAKEARRKSNFDSSESDCPVSDYYLPGSVCDTFVLFRLTTKCSKSLLAKGEYDKLSNEMRDQILPRSNNE